MCLVCQENLPTKAAAQRALETLVSLAATAAQGLQLELRPLALIVRAILSRPMKAQVTVLFVAQAR